MKTPDTKMCICGELECLGGAEVELAGVCHRPNNPCYIIDRHTPDTEWLKDAETEYDRQFTLGVEVDSEFKELEAFVGAWDKYDCDANDCPMTSRDRKIMYFLLKKLRTSRDTYLKERVRSLMDYIEHDNQCIISQAHRGRPTNDGGYETQYGDKWYRSPDKPECDCGLDTLLDNLK